MFSNASPTTKLSDQNQIMYPIIQLRGKNQYTMMQVERQKLTSANNFKKSLNLLSTRCSVVIPSGDCRPTCTL